MRNKGLFVFSILLTLTALILMIVGLIVNLPLFVLSLLFFIVGIALIMWFSPVSFSWQCGNCGAVLEISLLQNLFILRSGENEKKLYCPKCHAKTSCYGIPKDAL